MHNTNIPPIAVLMATYNGALYLKEQIDSILNQSLEPTIIIVSDDGSEDGTHAILEKYAAEGKITFIKSNILFDLQVKKIHLKAVKLFFVVTNLIIMVFF
jgi:glycosyltransferase involved in cell wall biosynthesis